MRQFEDYVLESFDHTTGWYQDNSYEGLNRTADQLMQFRLPTGLKLSFSSLATPNFSTSYHLGAGGRFDGSICYLFSSVPLKNVISSSESIPLAVLLRSYRQVQDLPPVQPSHDAIPPAPSPTPGERFQEFVKQPWLVFGRMFLPESMLEAQVVKRASPNLRFQVKGVSQADLPNGGTILGSVQYTKPRYGVAGLLSTDGGLLGFRGLYNFGGDTIPTTSSPRAVGSDDSAGTNGSDERERIYGRFSAGGELYYGVLNKSAGASLGVRFATLPAHSGTPLTATFTLAPLMGNISSSFAVMARQSCSLATRFDFNVYSYESDWTIGMELWGKGRMAGLIDRRLEEEEEAQTVAVDTRPAEKKRGRSFQAKMEWRLDEDDEIEPPPKKPEEEFSGVLKARMDQHSKVGLLWEGRLKSLIFSLGTSVNLSKPEQSFRSLGLAIQYSS
ncbi:Mitochondrial distribution and morphology protein 10 [Pyricularia grisea]|nr:Mitochondrial distribution and morphology protein 10 [Pyricularia grisea]